MRDFQSWSTVPIESSEVREKSNVRVCVIVTTGSVRATERDNDNLQVSEVGHLPIKRSYAGSSSRLELRHELRLSHLALMSHRSRVCRTIASRLGKAKRIVKRDDSKGRTAFHTSQSRVAGISGLLLD